MKTRFFISISVTCPVVPIDRATLGGIRLRAGETELVSCLEGFYVSDGVFSFNVTCLTDLTWEGIENCTGKQQRS